MASPCTGTPKETCKGDREAPAVGENSIADAFYFHIILRSVLYAYSNETQMHVIIENWQIQIWRCSSVRNGLDYCAQTMRGDAPDHAAQLSLSHVAHALVYHATE